MLSSNDIRNIKFSKSVGGYKQEEVDILLDKIETDYEQYERTFRSLSEKIDTLNAEIDGYKNSQNSIQNVLLSAQKLADQIIEDAKAKSEEIINNAEANISIITAREKELSNAFELKAGERKAAAENEINEMLAVAKKKAGAIEKASADSVNRQQVLFDKIKLEIAGFKNEITKKYKEHLELLQKLPDTASMTPQEVAEILSAKFDAPNDVEVFMEAAEENFPNKSNQNFDMNDNKDFNEDSDENPSEEE